MKVHGLVWVGTRTDRFDETVAFFRDTLGVPLSVDAADFAFGRMPNGSVMEVFGPSDSDHEHFSTGPVPEFLVDDVVEAVVELRAAGVEILGEPGRFEDDAWAHFRAPDGKVYGVTASPKYARP